MPLPQACCELTGSARISDCQSDFMRARRLARMPRLGSGPSRAFSATSPAIKAFCCGRDYADWLRLRLGCWTDRVPDDSPRKLMAVGEKSC